MTFAASMLLKVLPGNLQSLFSFVQMPALLQERDMRLLGARAGEFGW